MSNHLIDPCAAVGSHSPNIFGDVSERRLSAREARRMLASQQALLRDRLRGNENDLRDFGGPMAHVPDIGLLVLRGDLSEGDFQLQSPQVNAKIKPYDPAGNLDRHDMLRGAVRWEQPIGTCFMMGDRTILTARHNFFGSECMQLFGGFVYAVFGHSVLDTGEPRRTFTVNENVFRVKAPEQFHLDVRPPTDWIKLELDDPDGVLVHRPVTPLMPIAESGGDVYTLGHPNGLTLRYSRSKVITRGPLGCTFSAFLDGYPVASGSPVFDFATDRLLGVMIRGSLGSGTGQVDSSTTRVSLVCADGGDIEATLCVASDAFA